MDDVLLTRDLLEVGSTHFELATAVEKGRLEHVRRGAYARSPVADPVQAHRRLIAATLAQTHPGAVVSHTSAAVLHGLPVPRAAIEVVHLTRDRHGGGQRRAWLRVHGHPLPDGDVTVLAGVLATSLERTLVDVACTLPLTDAVAVADAGLRRGAGQTDLAEVLGGVGRRTGISRARRVLELADATSESYGESISRVVMIGHGLPRPLPQVSVFDRRQTFVGRTDFAWPELGVVGEFDGRVKYGRDLAPGQDLAEVLWREKLREDRLRELGWLVVRWIWSDLDPPQAWFDRLTRALEQGGHRPSPDGSWRAAARVP